MDREVREQQHISFLRAKPWPHRLINPATNSSTAFRWECIRSSGAVTRCMPITWKISPVESPDTDSQTILEQTFHQSVLAQKTILTNYWPAWRRHVTLAPERLYKIEDYKVTASRKTVTLALRRQFGDKKQFVSFSLKSIPRETGLKIMQEALSKLHNGMTEDKCQDWLAKQHRCLSASDVD